MMTPELQFHKMQKSLFINCVKQTNYWIWNINLNEINIKFFSDKITNFTKY